MATQEAGFTVSASTQTGNYRKAQVNDAGEVIHGGPLAIPQSYEDYRPEHHRIWQLLHSIQKHNCIQHACKEWRAGYDALDLSLTEIPRIGEISDKLWPLSGWQAVPVSGILSSNDYFYYLSQRQYPCVVTLRPRAQLARHRSPDLFHDLFGTIPMVAHPTFARFLERLARKVLTTTDPDALCRLHRLYWHIVQHGVVHEDETLKAFGAALVGDLNCWRRVFGKTRTVVIEKLSEAAAQDCAYYPNAGVSTVFALNSIDDLERILEVS